MRSCQRYASVPRPKLSEVSNTDEWISSSTSSTIKSNEKLQSNILNLTSSNTTSSIKATATTTSTTQPFCDPPLKTDDPDAKHTFKETEQDVVILPTDLNKNASVSIRQLCDYYTRLSKKNLTSKNLLFSIDEIFI